MEWFAKIVMDEKVINADRYKMVLFNTSTLAVTLWRNKSFDEALVLLDQFQADNNLSGNEAAERIVVIELMA